MSDPVVVPAAAPAPVVEPSAAPAPAPVAVEPAPAAAEPAAAPAAPESDDQANKSIVQKMNDFIKEVASKNKPKDPTAFAGAPKEPEKDPEKPVEVEDFKSKYEELAPKLAEIEPKFAQISQENAKLVEFQEGVNSLWEDLTNDPVVGKAVAKWLDLRGQNKAMPVDEKLAKVMELFVSGKQIDWAAVEKGVSTSDSAPASVASAPSAPAPQKGNGLQAAFIESSGRSAF